MLVNMSLWRPDWGGGGDASLSVAPVRCSVKKVGRMISEARISGLMWTLPLARLLDPKEK